LATLYSSLSLPLSLSLYLLRSRLLLLHVCEETRREELGERKKDPEGSKKNKQANFCPLYSSDVMEWYMYFASYNGGDIRQVHAFRVTHVLLRKGK
jgi:hypothetical protein